MKLTYEKEVVVTTETTVDLSPMELVSAGTEPELFDELRKFILSKEFHSCSCSYDHVKYFFSKAQGGIDCSPVKSIRFLNQNGGFQTWSFLIDWGDNCQAVLIVK
jgi:hypothetical protein